MHRLLFAILPVGLCLVLTGCLSGVSREFVALRDEALPRSEVTYEPEFQHRIGGFLLGLARWAARNDENGADAFLQHLEKAEIGVYRLVEPYDRSLRQAHSDRLGARMAQRGFYPVVRVRDQDQIVGIYAPDGEIDQLSELILCVVEEDEVVLVQVKGHLEKLAPMLAQGEHDFAWHRDG